MSEDNKRPGQVNAKIADSEIQGTKGGNRNRAATKAGVMPPPAGEPRSPTGDPRTKAKSQGKG